MAKLAVLHTICLGAMLGCAGPSASGYDALLDQRITALDARVETFLDHMERAAGRPETAYRVAWQVYGEIRGELEALRRRAGVQPRATELVPLIGELSESIELVRKSHEAGGDGGLNRVVIQQLRPHVQEKFQALYRRLGRWRVAP